MNAKTLAELALKIWGIILLVGALAALPVSLLMARVDVGSDSQAAWFRASQTGSILQLLIQVVVGIAVVVWADRITELIESNTTPLQINASTHELQRLGFALVGVVILVQGLQHAAVTAYTWFTMPRLDQADSMSYLWEGHRDAIVRAIVQVGAGALLVFGRKAIVDGWSRLRGRFANDAWDDSEDDDRPVI
jgi:hypothetical protein